MTDMAQRSGAAAALVDGGFTQPVFEAQAVFRGVMDAMGRPGTVQRIATKTMAPAPLDSLAASIILTLCDQDTSIWLDAALGADHAVGAWIGFHTSASITSHCGSAAFAIVTDPATMPRLSEFALGTQEYPDRSTTLIIALEALDGGKSYTLSGPGIETAASLAPSPLPTDFHDQWLANGAAFPRGVDIILVAPEGIVALPRTTRLKAS